MGMGLFGELALNVNVAVPRLLGQKPEKRWFVRKPWMTGIAKTAIADFEVAGAAAETTVRLLSGGNAQKLMLAREFAGHFAILIAHFSNVQSSDTQPNSFINFADGNPQHSRFVFVDGYFQIGGLYLQRVFNINGTRCFLHDFFHLQCLGFERIQVLP